jgi:hypothetical protein
MIIAGAALARTRRSWARPRGFGTVQGQPLDERGEDGPVCPVQAGSGVRAAEHGDLVPEDEQFDVLDGGRATQQHEQSEHLLEDQYNSRSDRAAIMPSRWRSSILAGQRQVQHCGTPQDFGIVAIQLNSPRARILQPMIPRSVLTPSSGGHEITRGASFGLPREPGAQPTTAGATYSLVGSVVIVVR